MARSRNIKPGICQNETLAELSCTHRYLFAVLPCFVDREGRTEDRPLKLKMQIFPADNCDMDGLLQDLHDASMILRYEVGKTKYIQIPTFSKHQNPHVNERNSDIPPPPKSTPKEGSAPEQHQSNPADSLIPITDSFNPSTKDAPSDKSLPAEFLRIPLVDKSEYPVTEDQITEWQEAYPGIDVAQQVREIRQWNIANPNNRKTRAGILRHITAWLGKEQNRAPTGKRNGTHQPNNKQSAASRQDAAAERQAANL